MDRRAFITMVGGSILAAPLLAQGQPQSAKVYTIGVITNTGSAADVSGPNPEIRTSLPSYAVSANSATSMVGTS